MATESEISASPQGIRDSATTIGKLTEGYKSGRVKESHYLGQLNGVVKNLRSRYPGYDEQIDNIISSITGLTPANSIISALRQEAMEDQGSRDHDADQLFQFEKERASEIERAIPGWFSLSQSDRMARKEEMFAKANYVNAGDAEIKLTMSRLQLQEANNNLSHEDLVRGLNDSASILTGQALNAGLSATGQSAQSLKETVDKWGETGEVPPPEELNKMLAQVQTLKSSVTNNVIQMAGPQYNQLSSDEKKNLLEGATAQIDTLMQALVTGDAPMIKAQLTYIEAVKSTEQRHMLEQYDWMRKIQAGKDFLGEAAVGMIVQKNMSEVSEALGLGLSVSKGELGNQGVTEEFKRLSAQSGIDPKLYTVLMDSNTEGIVNPETNPVLSEQNVTWMYGKNGGLDLQLFPAEHRTNILSKLSTPGVTARIKSLSEDKPELWKNYSGWVYRNFKVQYAQLAANIQQIPPGVLDTIDFYWDEGTGQIGATAKPVSNPNELSVGASWVGPPSAEAYQTGVLTAFKEANLALASVKPVVEADGQDFNTGAAELLAQLGLPVGEFIETEEGKNTRSALESLQGNLLAGEFNIEDVLGKAPTETGQAIRDAAKELGVNPADLATVIAYETGGSFSTSIMGGKGGNHLGLIQFGKREQQEFGASSTQTVSEQLKSVVKYLKARGLQPGSGLLDIYSTINAGRPGRYSASDRPGSTVSTHVASMRSGKLRELAESIIGGEIFPVPQ